MLKSQPTTLQNSRLLLLTGSSTLTVSGFDNHLHSIPSHKILHPIYCQLQPLDFFLPNLESTNTTDLISLKFSMSPRLISQATTFHAVSPFPCSPMATISASIHNSRKWMKWQQIQDNHQSHPLPYIAFDKCNIQF